MNYPHLIFIIIIIICCFTIPYFISKKKDKEYEKEFVGETKERYSEEIEGLKKVKNDIHHKILNHNLKLYMLSAPELNYYFIQISGLNKKINELTDKYDKIRML